MFDYWSRIVFYNALFFIVFNWYQWIFSRERAVLTGER